MRVPNPMSDVSRPRALRVLLVALLAVAAIAALAACGSSKDSSGGEQGEGSEEQLTSLPECSEGEVVSPPEADVSGSVHVVMEEVSDLEVIEGMIPEFNAEYPNVEIDIEGANYDVIRDKQIASFQKSEGTYDLMQVDTAWIPEYADSGFLVDLTPAISCLPASYDYFDFAPSFREIGQYDGQIYGVPFYSYPTGFIYRSDLWSEPPATLAELVEGAKKNTTSDAAGLALQPKQGQVILEEWNAFLESAGGSLHDADGNWTVESPEAEEALDAYIQVYENAAPENSLNWGFDETTRAAASGKASALTSYAWVGPIVNAPGGPVSGKFVLAPFPGGVGTGGAWQWGIPSNAEDKDAAWAWISWITSKGPDTERTIAGGAPIRDSVMDDPEVWEQGVSKEYYQTYKQIAAKAVPLCRGVGCAEAMEEIGVHLSSAVAGTESVQDALSSAQSAAEQATR